MEQHGIWNNTLSSVHDQQSSINQRRFRGVSDFAAFFAEKSSENVAYPVVLGQVLFLFLHLLQGVGHILHPTVVVLQSFLTGQISPFSTIFAPRGHPPTQTIAKM